MPEDLDTLDDEQQQHDQDDSPVITSLRKDRDTAKAEATEAKRELTLHKAGLGNLSTMQMKALTAAHEGDWEPDLLKTTATELGFVQSDGGQSTQPKIPAAELEAHERVAAAAGGQPAPPPTDLDAAIANAKGPEEIVDALRNAGRLAGED